MPELAEDMYCSQQICIPPSFPYLLRQFAKAAIRTQPGDLLRWSTAYFRCLALNVPPPVKPRLEYPIPKSHFGLTPGWLKALMHQLQNNLSVTFKILWDRWIGACLQHKNLIEVLLLGRFTDPWAIPWFRFVAICAAHLTENLTQTMMLVCDILTEEPEGGSAMIPLEVFLDIYKYLSAIDASEGQWLRNLYFTDSLLSLYREPVVEEVKESTIELEEVIEEEIVEPEEEKVVEVKQGPKEDLVGVVISCPDIAADDYKKEKDFVLEAPIVKKPSKKKQKIPKEKSEVEKPKEEEGEEKPPTPNAEEKSIAPTVDEKESVSKKESTAPSQTSKSKPPEVKEKPSAVEKGVEGEKPEGSVETLIDYMPPRQRDLELLEDLEKVKAAQRAEEDLECGCEEEEEEVDYDLVKLKRLLEGPVGSGIIASEVSVSEETEEKQEELEQVEEEEEEEEKGEMFYVEAVQGIGATVPTELVEAVEKYMRECATIQHGMVMPRNIRHYNCPPLEVFNKCACVTKVC